MVGKRTDHTLKLFERSDKAEDVGVKIRSDWRTQCRDFEDFEQTVAIAEALQKNAPNQLHISTISNTSLMWIKINMVWSQLKRHDPAFLGAYSPMTASHMKESGNTPFIRSHQMPLFTSNLT